MKKLKGIGSLLLFLCLIMATPLQAAPVKGTVNYNCCINSGGYTMFTLKQPHGKMKQGSVPVGTKVEKEASGSVKILTGHWAGSSGYFPSNCINWQTNQALQSPAKGTNGTTVKGSLASRKAFALKTDKENREAHYYTKYNGKVIVSGPNGTTMNYFDPDASANGLMGDTEWIENCRKAGFQKIIFKDGTAQGVWTIDLTKNPVSLN